MLDKTQITSLKCASHFAQRVTFVWTLCLCLPLRQQPLTLCLLCVGSLADNVLCGVTSFGGTYTTVGINALCDALKGNNTITSLKYASQLESLPTVNSL